MWCKILQDEILRFESNECLIVYKWKTDRKAEYNVLQCAHLTKRPLKHKDEYQYSETCLERPLP